MSGEKNVFESFCIVGLRSCFLYLIFALVFSNFSFAGYNPSTARTSTLANPSCYDEYGASQAFGGSNWYINYNSGCSDTPGGIPRGKVYYYNECPDGFPYGVELVCYACQVGEVLEGSQCTDHGCDTGFNEFTQDCYPQNCGYGDPGLTDPQTCNDLPSCDDVYSNFCPDGDYCSDGYYYDSLTDRCIYGDPPGSSSSAQNSSAQNSSNQSSNQQSSQNSSDQSSDNSQNSSADGSDGSNNSDGGGSNSSGGSGGSSGAGSSSGGGDGESTSSCVEMPPCSGDAIQCAILEQQWINGCNKQKEVTGDCSGGFVCSGDPIGCAALEIQFLQQCQNQPEKVVSDIQQFMDSEGLGDYDDSVEIDESVSISDIAGEFMTPQTSYAGSCLEELNIDLFNGSFVIDLLPICEILGYLRIFIIASATLLSFKTFFKVGIEG